MNVDWTSSPATAASEFGFAPGAGASAAPAKAAEAKTAATAGAQPAKPFAFSLSPAWRREVQPEEVEPGEVELGEVEQGWAAAGRGFTELLWQAGEDGALGDGSEALEASKAEEDIDGEAHAVADAEATGGGLSWEAAIRMIVAPSPHWGVPEIAGVEEESAGETSAAPLPPVAVQAGAKAMPAGPLTALPWAAVEQTMTAGGKASGGVQQQGEMAAEGDTEKEKGTAARGSASGAAASFEVEAAFDEGQTGGTAAQRQDAVVVREDGPAAVRLEDLREAGRGAQSWEDGSALEAGSPAGNAAAEIEDGGRQTGVPAMSAEVTREAFAAAGKREAVVQATRTAGPAHRALVQSTQAAGAMAAGQRQDSPDDGAGEGGGDERRGQPAPVEREQRMARGREEARHDGEGHDAAGRETEAARVAAGQSAMARSVEPGRAAVAAHSEGSFVQEYRRAEANGGEALPGAERLPMHEITPVSTPLAPRTVQIQVVGERGEDVQATISATAGGGVQVRLRAAGAELSQAIEQGAPMLRERLEQAQTPRASEVWDAAAWSAEAGAGVRAAAEGTGQFGTGQENARQENAGRDNGAPGEGERGGRHSGGERRERHAEADGEEFEAYFQAGGRR